MKSIFIFLIFVTAMNCDAENGKTNEGRRETASAKSEGNPEANARANHWTLLAKYTQVSHIFNSYISGSGQRYRDSQNVDYRFVGMGVAYQYNLNENWSVFPEVTYSKYLQNSAKNTGDLSLLVGSLNIARNLGNGQVFAGISTQQVFPTSGLKYTPSVGLRAGYELYLGEHSSLNFGFEFLTFKSENAGAGISSQDTEMRSYFVAYGYRI